MNLLLNPILIKCARSRLRPGPVIVWSVVTFVFSAFLFLIFYLWLTQQHRWTPADAAKVTLIPLIVVQGFILMLLGTGSVASGLAFERDCTVLDYHRLSPMTPTSKILGYLFGLPIREYVLFGVTLPFVLTAIAISEIAIPTVLHFYTVFFSTVWLYHMTGMVAGMISPRPRRASLMAQGLVLVLYIFLPYLSRVGFSFLGYLTIAPTFFSMLSQQVNPDAHLERWVYFWLALFDTWEHAHFFNWIIHSTVFTLALQASLIVTLFVVVHRKWRQETNHAFGKLFSLLVYAAMQLLLVGSLWPYLNDQRTLPEWFETIDEFRRWDSGREDPFKWGAMLLIFLYVFFVISGLTAFLLIHVITPTPHHYRRGLRRSHKLGLPRLPVTADAASNLPYACGIAAMTSVSYVVLMGLVTKAGVYFDEGPPMPQSLLPLGLFVATVLYVAGVRGYWGTRGFLYLFLLWCVPFMTYFILLAGWREAVGGAYVSTPSPITSLFFAIIALFYEEQALVELHMAEWYDHTPTLTLLSLFISSGLAVTFLSLMVLAERRMRRMELVNVQ